MVYRDNETDCEYGNDTEYDLIAIESPSPRQVLRIALNLKYLIDTIIPFTISEDTLLCDSSPVLTEDVQKAALEGCGGDPGKKLSAIKYQSVVIFALLKVASWQIQRAEYELHDEAIYRCRALAAQQLAKLIIDKNEESDLQNLFLRMLLRRYVINENDCDSDPLNAIELAVDQHSTIVISSSGFQRCLRWLWRGWIIQDRSNPMQYVPENNVASNSFTLHFNPDRVRTPRYQNILELFFSVVYVVLYTIVVNGKWSKGVQPVSGIEIIFYIYTFGFIADQCTKFYKSGLVYFSFWNAFNDSMYIIITLSIIFRLLSASSIPEDDTKVELWDKYSFRMMSCAAPLVWSRLLLYLESQRFVGVLLVVLKHMMQESIVFFFLLLLVMIGFLQGFLGLDSSDGERDITKPILTNLIITIMSSGSFDVFEKLAPPYAAILYYAYSFIVSVLLMNLLIAVYTNAYDQVVSNAANEYMALIAQKILRYSRTPDENVFVSPLNVIELAISPFVHLMSQTRRTQVTYVVMLVIYSPVLLITSVIETQEAKRIQYNRLKRLDDDANEVDTPWDLTDGFVEDNNYLFTDENIELRATQKKNARSLELQRLAEKEDPSFILPKEWFMKVKSYAKVDEKSNSQSNERVNSDSIQLRHLKEEIVGLQQKLEHFNKIIDELSEIETSNLRSRR